MKIPRAIFGWILDRVFGPEEEFEYVSTTGMKSP